MKCLALLCAALFALPLHAKDKNEHEFGVIGHVFAQGGAEAQLEQAIAASREPSLAFVVVTGIKGEKEACTDNLYAQRRELFEESRRPVVVVPAASDWASCKNAAGRPVPLERLNRLRELFYPEPISLGRRAMPLQRLSASAKFRSYAENAQWIVGNVLYATVNLPANNNHYRPEAGRNSEYEDRLVANRAWLSRLFALARSQKLDAVVLFSEGDAKVLAEKPGLLGFLRSENRQDGFAAPRRQIGALAKQFTGKVLLVDAAPLAAGAEPAIEWRDNLGHVSAGSGVLHVRVTPGDKHTFTLEKP